MYALTFAVLLIIHIAEGKVCLCGLLPGQGLEELIVLDGSEGKIWQDGQQVSQQATVGCQEVGSYHDNGLRDQGLAPAGVLGCN